MAGFQEMIIQQKIACKDQEKKIEKKIILANFRDVGLIKKCCP